MVSAGLLPGAIAAEFAAGTPSRSDRRATAAAGDALDSLRREGVEITDEAATHLTPAQHDHINYGTYSFDIDAELRREGHRPLRIPA